MSKDNLNLFPNPALYRKLSEPFSSLDEANKEMNDFLEGVGELRKKHKIPNVQIIIMGSALTENDGESEFIAPCHFGDSLRAEMMLAYSLGIEQKGRQEKIGGLLAKAIQKQKDRG